MRKSRWLLALRIFCFLEGKVILMDTGNQFLGTERIGKLMRQYAVPCIISLLVGALYNIVDQIFIANASYLGSYGNAANTVVFPLTVVALGIAVFIGDGCCAFVSIALGRNAREDAHRSVGNAIVLCVVSSLVLTAVYLMFSESILVLFGGTVNEETHTFAKEYFFCITLGIPFYMFGQAMNPVIRSDGSPKFAMVSTVSGAIANVIFDPIFIYGFHWGMMGAAVATVIGQVLTAVLAVWYLRHMKVIKLDKSSFRLDGKLIPKIPGAGADQLSRADLAGRLDGSGAEYVHEIRCEGPRFRAAGVCADSACRPRHRHEVFPDCDFHRHRHGGWLYSDCGV